MLSTWTIQDKQGVQSDFQIFCGNRYKTDFDLNSPCKVHGPGLVVMCTHGGMWRPEVESHIYLNFILNFIFINLRILNNVFYHIQLLS